MTKSTTLREAAVRHYLATGDHDSAFRGWPGDNIIEATRGGSAVLREALLAKVRARTASLDMLPAAQKVDVAALTASKVAPMVAGLFPSSDQSAVLAMLKRSVVFPEPDNIESVLRSTPWLRTAWALANMYLVSLGAERLSRQAPNIVGLSQEATCYVSLDYFREQDQFADYLVHEVTRFQALDASQIFAPTLLHEEPHVNTPPARGDMRANLCVADTDSKRG